MALIIFPGDEERIAFALGDLIQAAELTFFPAPITFGLRQQPSNLSQRFGRLTRFCRELKRTLAEQNVSRARITRRH